MQRVIPLEDGRDVQLIRATVDDSQAIFDLYDDIYQGAYTLDIVNRSDIRDRALADPDCYWLINVCEGRVVGSVIFEVDAAHRAGKVFAAVVHPEFRRHELMYVTISHGINALMHRDRLVDVIYATTRTSSIGPSKLLKKLGFVSLGIFPNVHRLADYETHGLNAIFHPEAFEKRRRLPRLIPEVEGFYRIIRQTFHLEPAEIVPVRDVPRLRIVRGDAAEQGYRTAQQSNELLCDFFPFHDPNFMFQTEDGSIRAFVNYEGKDGHGVVVGLKAPLNELKNTLIGVFEAAQRVGVDYLEMLVDSYEPDMQRAALQAQFLPCAYFPSMEEHDGVRRDYLVFARTTLPLNFSNVQMTPRDRQFLDVYLQNTEYRNLVVKMHFTGPLDEGEVVG
jgi:hypothetical protein